MKQPKKKIPEMLEHEWESMQRMAKIACLKNLVEQLMEKYKHQLSKERKELLRKTIEEAQA